MWSWRSVPFLRPLAGFAAGIFAGANAPSFWGQPSVLTFLFGMLMLGLLLLKARKYRKRWQFGIWVLLLFFVLGAWHRSVYPDLAHPDFVGNLKVEKRDYLLAEALEWPQDTRSGHSRKLLCRAVMAGGKKCSGLFLLYFPPEDEAFDVRAGSLLLLPARLREISAPENPFAFDYRAYMVNKQVCLQLFVRAGEYSVVGLVKRPWYRVLAFRQKLLGVLRKHLQREEVLAVVSAMVLGERAYMSDELRDSYARSGAMHVLAVSGLHMGLIYFFMLWLFDRLGARVKRYKGLRFFVGMAGLWGFALLTGASPSVLRAATLFSFVLAGKWVQEFPNTFNSLAASAFCLLWYNPLWLNDLSFQLSYLAILGILLLQHDIFLLWLPGRSSVLWAWRMTSVSIAAQLSTAPLGMYYFHRFSNGFWLSSLLVIPAAPLILLGSLLLFLCDAFLPFLAPWLGKGLELLVLGVNAFLDFLSHLPGQSIEGIFFTSFQLFLSYGALVCLVLFLKQKRGRYFVYGLALLLAVSLSTAFRQIQVRQRTTPVVYQLRGGKKMIDVFCGGQRLTIADKDVSKKEESYAADGMRLYMGAVEIARLDFARRDSFCSGPFVWRPPFVLAGSRLFALRLGGEADSLPLLPDGAAFPVDSVLLSNE